MIANRALEFAASITGTQAGGEGGAVRFGVLLPFDATQVVIANDGAHPVYLSLASSAGSTGGFEVRALEAYALDAIRTNVISVASTTTSTSDGYRIGAWGG